MLATASGVQRDSSGLAARATFTPDCQQSVNLGRPSGPPFFVPNDPRNPAVRRVPAGKKLLASGTEMLHLARVLEC